MARIAGVNIPNQKRVPIGLTYIHGIGRSKALEICNKVGIPTDRRAHELTDDEVLRVRELIDRDYTVEGDLRRTGRDEHQAADGPGLLSRAAAPQGPAGPRPAHPHQCAHAQRPGAADRRQEEISVA